MRNTHGTMRPEDWVSTFATDVAARFFAAQLRRNGATDVAVTKECGNDPWGKPYNMFRVRWMPRTASGGKS